jgi:chorismate synthase
MPSTIGNTLRVSVFGQSHSEEIGCVIEGLPAGLELDTDAIARLMARRAPGQGSWSTSRKEADEVRIVSGLDRSGFTCGAPLALTIANTNARSADYDRIERVPRPGHADWVARMRWDGHHDVAGGGHFSGRLTAPLCAAGAICEQALASRGVRVGAHLSRCAGIDDEPFAALGDPATLAPRLSAQLDALAFERPFPVIDPEAGEQMVEAIGAAHAQGDSVGGIIECVVTGLPAGIGSPMFDGMENLIARAAFGIPAVKGIEFGRGFAAADMRGSEHNDPYAVRDGEVCVTKNDAGGILGGITDAAPVLFRLAVKPTASIAAAQDSVDLDTMRPERLEVRGRHDPCIAPRAVPVAEAVAAICALDAWLSYPPGYTLDNALD